MAKVYYKIIIGILDLVGATCKSSTLVRGLSIRKLYPALESLGRGPFLQLRGYLYTGN